MKTKIKIRIPADKLANVRNTIEIVQRYNKDNHEETGLILDNRHIERYTEES